MRSVIFLLVLVATAVPGEEKHQVGELKFMSGHWTGSQATDELEEMWSPPANGSMIGMYREMKAGKTTFYEFLAIEQETSGPILRMKHFMPNLIGREEKDQTVTFDLQSLKNDTALFVSRDNLKPTSLSYQRIGSANLLGILVRERDGKTIRDEFHYKLLP